MRLEIVLRQTDPIESSDSLSDWLTLIAAPNPYLKQHDLDRLSDE